MKIVGFMCITNPEYGKYPYLEAVASHLEFLDKLLIIDGGSEDGSLKKIYDRFENEIGSKKLEVLTLWWPQGHGMWTWEEFSHHWNFGLDKAKESGADWVCAAECDHVFHENDASLVRSRLEEHGRGKMIGWVDKMVSSVWWKWRSKSKFAYFLNVKEFPMLGYGMDRTFKGGQDLANPIQVTISKGEFGIPEGFMVTHEMGKNLGLYFWNYDKTFQTEKDINRGRDAANWAWNNGCLVKLGIMPAWEDKNVLEDVMNRMVSRYESSTVIKNKIEDHPKSMKEKLSTITEDMLGYNLFKRL